MTNGFKAEWRKLRQRPAVWWLGASLVAIVFALYAFSWIEYTSSSFHVERGITVAQLKATLYPANFSAMVVSGIPLIGGALMVVIGGLVVGSEYAWTTFKTIYTQRPGRLEVLAGEVAALAAINAIVVVALYAAAALSSLIIVNLAGATAVWPAVADILKALAVTWLIFEVWILFGMVLAYLFRQSALAIGLGLAYMLAIETILFRALRDFNLDWLTSLEKFMVGQNATSLSKSFPGGGISPATTLVSIDHAVLVIVAYAVVFLVIAGLLVRGRDVA